MGSASVWTKARETLADFFFPFHCLGCKTPDTALCDDCLSRLPRLTGQVCPACKRRVTPGGRICSDCRGRNPGALDALLVACPHHPLLDRAIHTYKYGFVESLAGPLGRLLVESALSADLPLPDTLVSVPLHPRRERWRDFNQSSLLAEYLSNNLTPGFKLPLSHDLKRVRYTSAQARSSSRRERLAAMENAFAWESKNPPTELKGKRVWLVDDVATMLATLDECAKVLKEKAGATEVIGFVLAR